MSRRDAVWVGVGVVVAATAVAWCGFCVHFVTMLPSFPAGLLHT